MFSSLSESWKNTWESTSDVKVITCGTSLLKSIWVTEDGEGVFFFTVIRVFFTSLKVVSSQFQCTCHTVNVKVHTLRQSNSQGCATLWHHVRFHFPSMKLHNYCTNLMALKVITYGWAEVHTSSLYLCWFPLHITYHNSMFNIFNLQELIPEFFYFPEMLLNENKVPINYYSGIFYFSQGS